MTTLIKNVKVLAKDFSGFNDLNVLLSDDRIYDITSEISDADIVIDGKGGYLLPGFIDVHTHGRCGMEFM